ncbi:alpha/beta hydrolase [Loktanella sp. 5RATIMAR09]|uniref:alpha/beta hydrolase n=1 Tax=Loktanella sp. 5RATIMAR09 TaxID=1225655 RepID=UPI0012ED3FEF|nr:alpha/beta hydrolase [Loktanella sp. 5RATIMAR09]
MSWLWMLVGTYLLYAAVMVMVHPRIIYPFGADAFENPAFRQEVVSDRDVSIAISEGADDLAVLFFMGNGGSLAYFTYALEAHQTADRTVAALEYRGGAGIAGRPSEAGLKADALAAYDWLAAQHEGPIAVHGFSLGTGLAIHVAARRDVAAILLDAPYPTLCALMTKGSYLPACYLPFVQKWRSLDDVPALNAPVLVQHGTADQLIPIGYGMELADAMKAVDLSVTFHGVEGATHNNLAGQSGYQDRINAFLTGLTKE